MATILLVIELTKATYHYFNFDSIVELKIYNKHFDYIDIPPIKIGFFLSNLKFNQSFKRNVMGRIVENNIMSDKKIQDFYDELKRVEFLICKIIIRENTENFDRYMSSILEILTNSKNINETIKWFTKNATIVKMMKKWETRV